MIQHMSFPRLLLYNIQVLERKQRNLTEISLYTLRFICIDRLLPADYTEVMMQISIIHCSYSLSLLKFPSFPQIAINRYLTVKQDLMFRLNLWFGMVTGMVDGTVH